ncbi:MAG TPA: ABC transporter substrate-binding protein [Patescibacteria group bacterium]|nr:ABC transporter substrate-binding protein [Patescibacteria group bacterium]
MAILKKAFVFITVLAVIPLFCRVDVAERNAEASEIKTLRKIRVVIFPQPRSLLPYEGNNYVDGQITDIIFSNLIKANYLGNIAPELAESWEISPDHREFTFHIRKNVRFHNGRQLTVSDVVFTMKKLIEKAQDKFAEIHYIDGVEDFINKKTSQVRGIQKIDDFTVKIKLNKEFKYFLQFLSAEYTAILPAAFAGLSEADFRKNPVGTGPFKLTRSETKMIGSRQFLVFKMERNRDYFEPMGNLDAIDFYSTNTAIDTPTKEYFDILYISNNEISELSGKPDFRIINSSFSIINFLILNPNENIQMQNQKIRQLVNCAINREELVRKVFRRQAVPAHSIMPFGLLGHNPYYRQDYGRAEKIRAELPPGKIAFTIITVAKDERQLVAEFVRRELAKFNVEAKVITIADQYEYFNNLIYRTKTSLMLGGIPDYPSSFHFLTHLVEKNGYFNVFKFAFPKLQAMINTLPSVDIITETRMLAEINAAFENDSIYIPLYYHSNFIAIRNRIKTIAFKYGDITDFANLEVADEPVH